MLQVWRIYNVKLTMKNGGRRALLLGVGGGTESLAEVLEGLLEVVDVIGRVLLVTSTTDQGESTNEQNHIETQFHKS